MKASLDNFRASAFQGILKHLKAQSIDVILYDAVLEDNHFYNLLVIANLK